jgi:hypothetical protein
MSLFVVASGAQIASSGPGRTARRQVPALAGPSIVRVPPSAVTPSASPRWPRPPGQLRRCRHRRLQRRGLHREHGRTRVPIVLMHAWRRWTATRRQRSRRRFRVPWDSGRRRRRRAPGSAIRGMQPLVSQDECLQPLGEVADLAGGDDDPPFEHLDLLIDA